MNFFDFLNTSVTPYHTVNNLKSALGSHDIQLFEREGALIAVKAPQTPCERSNFRLALAHTDFPALKLTPSPDTQAHGIKKLHPEVYGSPLFTSWLDRDLGYAGAIAVKKDNQIQKKLIRGTKLFKIPQLAIHLNRSVNQDGLKLNPQIDLDTLWDTSDAADLHFAQSLCEFVENDEELLDFDIQLFDAQPAAVGGFKDQWIYSSRLDNLSSCHAIAQAMTDSTPLKDDFMVAGFFNNEEVGSTTREGASGSFLQSVLKSICERHNIPAFDFSDSFALSIDMAHAIHPNHAEKHDTNHAPVLGGGIVLKTNAQKRYASDLMSSAKLRDLCHTANIALQSFVCRNDIPCGSTVGPAISAGLGIPTVDIGEPMLSMHSIREMTAAKDHEDMIKLIKELWN
ncbi:MAG: M18 family aminopeptidase [Fibrobacter sp.]|nr:M18 family aminopeptidase [Fibrobacter sp.]